MEIIEIRVPHVADGVTSAKVAAWLKREGDVIASGEPLVEIETDKTTFEVEAPGSGVLQRIVVTAGAESVPVGTLIGLVGDAETAAGVVPARNTPAGRARHDAADAEPPLRLSASPLAARMMALEGLDAAAVATSAPGGRIMKADVEAVLSQRRGTVALPRPVDSPPAHVIPSRPPNGTYQERPLTAMRRVAAERLQQAKQTIPHFYLRSECHVGRLMDLRAEVKHRDDLIAPTVTDFLVLAAARALRLTPEANSMWVDSGVRIFDRIDIAVAVNTPGGLIAPIIRDADRKGIGAISRELKDLAERARQGRLRIDEYSDGTFTISNLGMFGVSDITPILNPPQTCILGVGAVEQRPVVVGGQITVGAVMSCTLAADHRAIDGALGAQLLASIRRMLEEPLSLLMS
jgi:pyruvate dehydrogenase E2 component (dihydrolipoamide acetyltransferase)